MQRIDNRSIGRFLVLSVALMHASHNLFIQAFFTPITAANGTITP